MPASNAARSLPLLDVPMVVQAEPLCVTAVVNPIKPAAPRALAELFTACADAGWDPPTVLETTIAEPGAPQSRSAVADGAHLVVALGGDGTVREVAHGLVGTGVQLGIVPLGTANLYARNLRITPGKIHYTTRMALHGMIAAVDVGLADFRDVPGIGPWSAELPFLVMAGIGQDANTVLETRDALKSRLGWWAYLESGARHAWRSSTPMRVSLDGSAGEVVRVWTVLAGNCGRIPAGIQVFPHARVDDGALEVLQARIANPAQWVPVAAQGFFHRGTPGSGLRYDRAQEVIVTPETPQPVQLDGDAYVPVGEARFRILRQRLLLRVPPPPRRRKRNRPVPAPGTR